MQFKKIVWYNLKLFLCYRTVFLLKVISSSFWLWLFYWTCQIQRIFFVCSEKFSSKLLLKTYACSKQSCLLAIVELLCFIKVFGIDLAYRVWNTAPGAGRPRPAVVFPPDATRSPPDPFRSALTTPYLPVFPYQPVPFATHYWGYCWWNWGYFILTYVCSVMRPGFRFCWQLHFG